MKFPTESTSHSTRQIEMKHQPALNYRILGWGGEEYNDHTYLQMIQWHQTPSV